MNPPVPVVAGVFGPPAECAVPADAAPVTTALLDPLAPSLARATRDRLRDVHLAGLLDNAA